jgi:hypothetical protein
MKREDLTAQDKDKLRQQIKLYKTYLSQYKFNDLVVEAIGTNRMFDTLRIKAKSIKENLRLQSAIKDINASLKTQIRVSRNTIEYLYIEVPKFERTDITYDTLDCSEIKTNIIDIPIGVKQNNTTVKIPLGLERNILICSGARMGKTTLLRTILKGLVSLHSEIEVCLFARKKEEYTDISGNIEYFDHRHSLSVLESLARRVDSSRLDGLSQETRKKVIIIDELYDFYPLQSQPKWNRTYSFLTKCMAHGAMAGIYFIISTSVFQSEMLTERFLRQATTRIFLRMPFVNEASDLNCPDAVNLTSSSGDALLITTGNSACRLQIPII